MSAAAPADMRRAQSRAWATAIRSPVVVIGALLAMLVGGRARCRDDRGGRASRSSG